ncbi:MAG: hypothetical protein HY391_05975 [Deltaproteobacteria bacterium]|nr:hypothetical protein [Deltaproteobacteria bacterium]
MERKLKPLIVQKVLEEKGVRLFSPEEFRRIFSVTLRNAQEFIKDHKADLFLKLRNGLYALRHSLPSELEIANRLYSPSYISFEYALSLYGLIPETVYTITSATTLSTRSFEVEGRRYEYSKIKRNAYRGYFSDKRDHRIVLIAEPEKALVDYLYFVDLKLKALNERLSLRKIKRHQAIRYALLFQRKSLLQLLKSFL